MKKKIPKWTFNDKKIKNKYLSKYDQHLRSVIWMNLEKLNLNIDEFRKYELVDCFFNKYFYDLMLMDEEEEIFSKMDLNV